MKNICLAIIILIFTFNSLAGAEILSCELVNLIETSELSATKKPIQSITAKTQKISVTLVSENKSKLRAKSTQINQLMNEQVFTKQASNNSNGISTEWYSAPSTTGTGFDLIQILKEEKKQTVIWFYHLFSRGYSTNSGSSITPPDYTYLGTCA